MRGAASRYGALAALVLLAAGAFAPARAQVSVTSADIQRLQDSVYDIGSEMARLRSRDSEQASRLQTELDDLRDEVIYLKVKMRKERSVSRSEYTDLRDRLDDLRSRVRGDMAGGSGSRSPYSTPSSTGSEYPDNRDRSTRTSSARPNEVPVGQEVDVRLQSGLNSGTSQVEDRFEATTLVDLYNGDNLLIPSGSVLRGVVSSVDPATRTDRKGRLTVAFDQITIKGRSYPIRATVTQALESEGIKGEAAKIGTGGAVGAIIGGILGGFKGALAGILIGAGGTVVATEGKNVDLPAGTILRVRFDSPLLVNGR